MFYEKRNKAGKLYIGHDRSDAEPGEYQVPAWKRRAIKRAYVGDEMTVRAIARHFGCHERTIARIARGYGLAPKLAMQTRNYVPVDDANFKAAWALWNSAVPCDRLTELLGCAPNISSARRKLLTEMRLRGITEPLPRKPRSDICVKRGPYASLYTREVAEKMRDLRSQGLSWRAIAHELGSADYLLRKAYSTIRSRHPDWFV